MNWTTPADRPSDSPPPRRWRRRRRLLLGIGVAVVAGVGVLVALTSIPATTVRYSGTAAPGYSGPRCEYCPIIIAPPNYYLPSGRVVSFDWYAVDLANMLVKFWTDLPIEIPCFWANATSGTCDFTSTGGQYYVSTIALGSDANISFNIDFTIEYSVPIL